MKKLITLFLFFPVLLFSQVFDDFEDGNFSENPGWIGSEKKFIVNDNKQLQINDTIANTAWLSTANSRSMDAEWRFWVKQSFSPSANNFSRFYIVSDQLDLSQPLQGYFIQLGESGSNDAIELFKQEGELLTSICRGNDGLISSSFQVSIKVIRDETGIWKIYVDPTGKENYQLEAEGFDNAIMSSSYLGVYCKYTVSNSTKFYFDDIYAGPIIIDSDPPQLINLQTESNSSLILSFNESIDKISSETISNYLLDQGVGSPISAILNEINPTIVTLNFDKNFINDEDYVLHISGIKDLAGNVMVPVEKHFFYYNPQPFDVVINEIMADPSPAIGLPEFEYLELFNQTDKIIDLSGWQLTIGSSVKEFTEIDIEPNEYLIIAHEDAEESLSQYGHFFGFSGFALTNKGQQLTLISKKGDTISQISYSDSWYHDGEKSEGGWSLEQMNPENICSGADNWIASMATTGGTPGAVNSVYNGILLLPAVERVEVVADNILRIYFNQMMELSESGNTENYIVDQDIGFPSSVYVYETEKDIAELYFETTFQPGLVYSLFVKKAVTNCIGIGPEKDTTISFGIGEQAMYNDIVINEILFNPLTNGVDYVELYNRSEKIIDVSLLNIGTGKISPPNPNDTSYYPIKGEQLLMLPNTYLLLTSSPKRVLDHYHSENPEAFLQIDPFPAYNNENGICLIVDGYDELIDVFDYNEDMHYPLFDYFDGVALERVNSETPTDDLKNWHSAAESVGFGTPGYKNSQYVSSESIEDNIKIEPEIFSPDNDGYNDIQSIKYTFDKPGYILSVDIFNAEGHLVKTLVNNEYLGSEGVINWDGIQNNNTKSPIGIYVYLIRVFDIEGNVRKYKKIGVLAARN